MQANAGIKTGLAIKAAGITRRQAQYWASTGLVTPSVRSSIGRGASLLYDLRDVVALRTIARLRSEGFSLQTCRRVQRILRADGRTFTSQRLLVLGGKSPDVVMARNNGELVSLVDAPGQSIALTMSLRDIERCTREALEQELDERELRKTRPPGWQHRDVSARSTG